MKPSRELDALIAEKVMGRNQVGLILAGALANIPVSDLPHYSTDIAAAWAVVEKALEIRKVKIEMTKGKFIVYFQNPQNARNTAAYAVGISAPHAICLAALKALSIPIPSQS